MTMKLIYQIPFFTAAKLLIGLLSLVVAFHLCVALGWIPNTIFWGGRIQSREEFYLLEGVSLLINLVLLWIIAQKAGYVKPVCSDKVLKFCLWAMTALFAVNTLGNMMAISALEKILFTPLTFVSAFLCMRLALGQNRN